MDSESVKAGSGAAEAAPLPIVGMGGSAGSLDAFKAFFANMPANSGAAYVVIQHLSPLHESLLPEILSRFTPMKVVQARDGAPVEADCVYVIAPDHYLGIRDGVLCFDDASASGRIHMSIDYFFRTLSEDRRERAIAVLFSGAGSDGTLGARAVREAGGLVVAQDSLTAQFPDMPNSIVSAGLADFVLSPERMPETILRYLRHPYAHEPAAKGEAPGIDVKDRDLQAVLADVQAETGCDFRGYKESTVLRRVERRMGLHSISDAVHYRQFLRRDPGEVKALFRDLLINVTSFFRDPESFEELSRKVLAPLMETKKDGDSLRIWVPGCATGEEAYSVAILAMEQLGASRRNGMLQVFASDIDEEALEVARHGVYLQAVAEGMSPARLARFFISRGTTIQVTDELRKKIIFANHNLISDPPFSRMDLVCCRNLLIYLKPETQAKVLALFHYVLNPRGYLFLGKSETVQDRVDCFETVSKNAHLYRRLTSSRPLLPEPFRPAGRRRPAGSTPGTGEAPPDYGGLLRRAMLSHFSAAVVLTDKKGEIFQFQGQTEKYLNTPASEPTFNLLDLVQEDLSTKLRFAFRQAVQEGKPVSTRQARVTREPGGLQVRLTVSPLPLPGEAGPMMAVFFEDERTPAANAPEEIRPPHADAFVQQLEAELGNTRQELQAVVAELQSANQELRMAGEEASSTNEELQSANEELESSTEELQSTNEELTTINGQLQEKIAQVDKASRDMANLLEASKIAALFVDNELRIKFFTPEITRILNMIQTDLGRPFSHLSMTFSGWNLADEVAAVARKPAVVEREIQHRNGSAYLLRLSPYLDQHGQPQGVIVTLADITSLRKAERQLAVVVESASDALFAVTAEGILYAWNPAAEVVFGLAARDVLDKPLAQAGTSAQVQALEAILGRVKNGESVRDLELDWGRGDGRTIRITLSCSPIRNAANQITGMSAAAHDITERRRTEQELALHRNHLEEMVRERTLAIETKANELARSNQELELFTSIISHDLKEPLRMVTAFLSLLTERSRNRLDATENEYIATASEGATRMLAMIDNLLDYARVGRKGGKTAVNLAAVVEDVIKNLAAAIRESGAAIHRPALPVIQANATEIGEVFQNLIANAIKFRGDRKPDIRIGMRRLAANGLDADTGKALEVPGLRHPPVPSWLFSVSDNGIGIHPSHTDRIFQIFERGHADENYAGTGIGLAICRKVIESHGGFIWMNSEPGRGSTFYFTVPA